MRNMFLRIEYERLVQKFFGITCFGITCNKRNSMKEIA